MEDDNKSSVSPIIWIVIVVALLCCCGAALIGIGGYAYYSLPKAVETYIPEIPTDVNDNLTPAPPAQLTRVPISDVSSDTVETLEKSIVPVNDLRDLACRLQAKCNVPETVPSGPFKEGAKQKFWIINNENAQSFQIDATLQYVTDHAYFWVQDDVNFNMNEAKELIDTFETKMYPTNREFFGSEWSPGIDGDVHIYIVYSRGVGGSVAGYFSSKDGYARDAYQYSNEHEMYVFNADNSPLSEPYTYGVLAHEFQHLIFSSKDRNEESWINEGFSEVAIFLNGYSANSAAGAYTNNTDVQLNDWGPDPGTNAPHYGAGFMFLMYFIDRFGKEVTQQLITEPKNGLEGIEEVLTSINAKDGVTGEPIRADDLFMDWAATNYLLDSDAGDGRFNYITYTNPPRTGNTVSISNCPENLSGNVHQYGVDYIHIACSGKFKLHFEGETVAKLLPIDPVDGKYAFWSNKGDESDMTLTQEFDFTGVSGDITLQYQMWHDLEKDYDYVFVEASTDGKVWNIIKTPTCTDSNPSGNSYGCAYNGATSGWAEEKVDLSAYAGKKVQIRFEYVTDAAVNGEGFMIDNISIPEINYSTDFETDDGGWQAAGFARIENALPQTFRLALILKGSKPTVQTITINADQTADVEIDLGGDVSEAVLIVTGTTRFTRITTNYTIEIK